MTSNEPEFIVVKGRRRVRKIFLIRESSDNQLVYLKTALGIAKVATEETPWRFKSADGAEKAGVQIDLLIDRADGIINLCEMKFHSSEFNIDAGYARELRKKLICSEFKPARGNQSS